MKILKPVTEMRNERGFLLELVKDGSWKQLSHNFTKAGNKRGNHYHKKTYEFFYVYEGKLKLNVENLKTGKKEEHIINEGQCFVVEPYDNHVVEALTDLHLIILLSNAFDENDPDLFRK